VDILDVDQRSRACKMVVDAVSTGTDGGMSSQLMGPPEERWKKQRKNKPLKAEKKIRTTDEGNHTLSLRAVR
jgi:hypothetical protein